MSQNLEIQEFVIAIAVKQQNPTVLTADFLKYSGIVPNEWELARPPVLTNAGAQVVFQNGVSVIAEVNRVVFSELIATKEVKEVSIPAIARKYIETLTQVSYQAISINFRGYVLFDQTNNTSRNFIFGKLLKAGSWQEFGTSPVQAGLRFIYTLKETQLFLDINEVGLQLPDQSQLPAILFSANFSHPVAQDDTSQRLANLVEVIGNWQRDLDTYKEVINTKFLTSESYQVNLAPNEPLIFPK
ncbi:hypothetical protein NIES2100_20400 [Calothrix sp. NIES-2100]|uniref:hypothetical protein n=1 Tax=Calothrix sp. NIES-2100 TaxID=1954172 RepID=UPI000B615C53|nr:hypothetical protein NIES2100_20400 [Calothrix sp. NIES-2100]